MSHLCFKEWGVFIGEYPHPLLVQSSTCRSSNGLVEGNIWSWHILVHWSPQYHPRTLQQPIRVWTAHWCRHPPPLPLPGWPCMRIIHLSFLSSSPSSGTSSIVKWHSFKAFARPWNCQVIYPSCVSSSCSPLRLELLSSIFIFDLIECFDID